MYVSDIVKKTKTLKCKDVKIGGEDSAFYKYFSFA